KKFFHNLPFLIFITLLFFNLFNDDLNFSSLSLGMFGSFSIKEIISSIEINSFSVGTSARFFIINRGTEFFFFFTKNDLRFFNMVNWFRNQLIRTYYYIESGSTANE